MNIKTFLTIAAAIIVTQLTGCAMVQTTANLETPVVANPTTGPAVKIVSVTDNRKFVYPHEAGDCKTPSVDSEKALSDSDLKARAYARQGRCDGGEWANHAMEVVPPGQTVASKVKEAVVSGFKKAGYRMSDSDPSAIPVTIQIDQFWTAFALDGMGGKYIYTYNVVLMAPDGRMRELSRSGEDKFLFGISNKLSKYSESALSQISEQTTANLLGSPL